MPKLIVGLEQNGYRFMNEVRQYCQVTGHPTDQEFVKNVYHECLSQILSLIHADIQEFMANLQQLPSWKTIHYLPSPVDYEMTSKFASDVKAMGFMIWHRLKDRGNLDARYFYALESCSEQFMIVSCLVDSGDSEVN